MEAKFPQYPDVTRDIVRDSLGTMYISDPSTVRMIRTNGSVTTLAGTQVPGSADGNGRTAQFFRPAGLAVDAARSVYVAEVYNHRIRKIWIDSDGDDIPDIYESAPTPFVVGVDDRFVDSDGDGISHSTEYLAGASATDPNSRFAIVSATQQTNGMIRIEWNSSLDKVYSIQCSDDLSTWPCSQPTCLAVVVAWLLRMRWAQG